MRAAARPVTGPGDPPRRPRALRCSALSRTMTSFPARLDGRPRAATEKAWYQHRDASTILFVACAEMRDQISFLELDADEDISRGHDREQQMPGSHVRRRPEGEQETQHEWVTHEPVQQRRLEWVQASRGSAERVKYLTQSEQLEMVDHVRRRQRRQPADPADRGQQGRRPTLHLPDRRDDRPPLPEDEDQEEARDQHIGTTLAGRRDDVRP